MATLLTEESLAAALRQSPEWTHHPERRSISRTYEFKGFKSAIRFVNRIAETATELDHHPDIDIRYNKVRLEVSTHSAGGLTELDFALAKKVEELAEELD